MRSMDGAAMTRMGCLGLTTKRIRANNLRVPVQRQSNRSREGREAFSARLDSRYGCKCLNRCCRRTPAETFKPDGSQSIRRLSTRSPSETAPRRP